MGTRTKARGALLVGALVVSLASAVVMALQDRWEAAARFAALAVLVVVVDRGGVPRLVAGAFAVAALLATWASTLHWYRRIDDIDLVVHFLAAGTSAAAAYFLLAEWRLLPDVRRDLGGLRGGAPVAWLVAVGLTLAVVWELYEWVVQQVAPAARIVGYTDTIGDLLAGLLGALAAGVLVIAARQRL